MGSSTLKIDGRIVVTGEGSPLKVEYGLFEAGEILLGKSALGRPIEQGYSTTAGEARRRLAQLGASPELADTCVDVMRPTLTEAYARGGAVRKIASLLDPHVLLEAPVFDGKAYEGTFLDLASLAHDLGRPSAGSVIQALSLAKMLADVPEDAAVELDTLAFTKDMKPGERTFQRVHLDGVSDLPALLEDLANRGGGRGARGDGLPRKKVEDLLAARLPIGSKLSGFIRAIETRDVPAKGPLAKAELWEIEILLDAGDTDTSLPRIESAERNGGRTPATAYLRARHDLLARIEPAALLAPRISALALSMSSFVELGLLAGEAWLAAGEGRRAQPYAKDVLETKGIDETLRDRAARVLEAAKSISPPATSGPPPALGRNSTSPSAAPGAVETRAPSFFPDPRAEPDLLEEISEPSAQARRNPSLPPLYLTPSGVSIPQVPPPPTGDSMFPPPPSAATGSTRPSEAPRLDATVARKTELPAAAFDATVAKKSDVPAKAIPTPASDRKTAPPPPGEVPVASNPSSDRTRQVASPKVRRPTAVGLGMGGEFPREEVSGTDGFVDVPFPSSFPSGGPATGQTEALSPKETSAKEISPKEISFEGLEGPESEPVRARPKTEAPPSLEPTEKAPESVHPAMREMPTPTLSGEFMRGATRPPIIEGEAPRGFAKAPLFPRSSSDTPEVAEHLSLPPGVSGGTLTDILPRSVLEARIQFTLMSRELGRQYRETKNLELVADLSGIEHMQAHLFERFSKRSVDGPEAARDVQLHGAFLSEILSRRLAAEWVDISADKLGHWEMMVAPAIRVWPFGRVSRLIVKGHKERDLVAYFLELQARYERR